MNERTYLVWHELDSAEIPVFSNVTIEGKCIYAKSMASLVQEVVDRFHLVWVDRKVRPRNGDEFGPPIKSVNDLFGFISLTACVDWYRQDHYLPCVNRADFWAAVKRYCQTRAQS